MDPELSFSAIAVDASPAHARYHLANCNNNVRNALNEHFEGKCGPFLNDNENNKTTKTAQRR